MDSTSEKFKFPESKMPKGCDAVFDGYTGGKLWAVVHPDHKLPKKVLAPSEQAAIYAAAKAWGETWTSEEFYARATARPTL